MATGTRARTIVLMACLALVGCGDQGVPTAPSVSPVSAQPPGPQPTAIQPSVTAVTPNVSSTRGGAWGTITGTDFQSGVTVQLGDTRTSAAMHGSTTVLFWDTAAHAAGTVDLVVTNPGGLSTRLARAYTFAPPESFDFNGDWIAHAGPHFETDMRFTIRNNVLVSVSCDTSAPLTFAPPPSVRDGVFSFLADGVAIRGTLVSPVNAAGTIDVPACPGASWWADKSGEVAGSRDVSAPQ